MASAVNVRAGRCDAPVALSDGGALAAGVTAISRRKPFPQNRRGAAGTSADGGVAATLLMMMKTTPQRVFDKNKIKGADNFLKSRGRAIDTQRAQPELSNNSFRRERRRLWHARVMTSKSAELVCVGSRNQRFAKFFRYLRRVPIGIEKALVKMTELNRVEAIDFIQ